MTYFGDPEIDKKLVGLILKVIELEENEEYDEAVSKNDELIASLEAFSIATDSIDSKRIYNSTMRDQKLLKRILKMKKKEEELEAIVDKLDSRVRKLEKSFVETEQFR